MPMRKPTFAEAYSRIHTHGPAVVVSSRNTRYVVSAEVVKGQRVLIARLDKDGDVRVHEDCWGDNVTCQGTRAGGIYNGSPSIFDWLTRA